MISGVFKCSGPGCGDHNTSTKIPSISSCFALKKHSWRLIDLSRFCRDVTVDTPHFTARENDLNVNGNNNITKKRF